MFGIVLSVSGCHSASWSPPEPQQAPDPTVSPTLSMPPPAPSSTPEPSASAGVIAPAAPPASTPPAVASGEPPPVASSADATSAPATSPSPSPASKPKAATAGSPKKADTTSPSDAYAGPDPCHAKTFHYSLIGSACKKAGRKPVKDIMRGVVKKAKAAGQDIQCTSCHADTSTYLLKPNAVSDIKQWL
jgi:hypothetical protein